MITKLPQGNVLQHLREWYRAHIRLPWLNAAIKFVLRNGVNLVARFQYFTFPQKYDWDWKLEMLLHRYEPETTALVRTMLAHGMTVIDIGAHIGYYSKLFSKLVGTQGAVYAFEPEPENFRLLQRNTKRDKNVEPINLGLSDREGTVDFYKMPNSTGLHSIVAAGHPGEKTQIRSTTLDAFIASRNIAKVDLIKIDIEGGEPFALRGGNLLLNQPGLKMIMEFTPSNFEYNKLNPLTFLRDFEKRGFTISTIHAGGITKPINLALFDISAVMNGRESINLFFRK